MKIVYVILINYNGANLSLDCIQSILKSKGCKIKIIVVDNKSSQDDINRLEGGIKAFNNENIVLIKNTSNNGFSSGNNIGINYALDDGAEYILLLNNDTIIDDKAISVLLNNVNNLQVSVPKMYYYDNPNTIWYAGGKIQWNLGKTIHLGENGIDNKETNKAKFVDFATGCCILLTKGIIEKVGLLDETFFMYGEDLDYSIRLANNNIKIYYVPEAKIWHKVGKSGGMKSKMGIYYGNRNRLYLMKKYNFTIMAWFYTLITRTLLYLKSVITKDDNQILLKAYNDYKLDIRGKVEI